MLDDRTRGLLLALLYPVQFDPRPELNTAHVMDEIVRGGTLGATPGDYWRAIQTGLQTDDAELAGILPDSHSGATVRSFLQQLSRSFAVAAPLPQGSGPLTRS